MTDANAAAFRGRLLATLRVQYPDAVADMGFRLHHPETGDRYTGDERHLVAPEPPGIEPDYHPASAYYESWLSMKAAD